MPEEITVLGAGIVGISCALSLQRRGYAVRLIDRRGPGEETSSGNAGVLSYSNITPLASPLLLARMLPLMLNRDADFLLHYAHLPALLPWLTRFLLRCRRATYLADGQAMAALTLPSIDLHRQWINQSGAQKLLNQLGVLKLYRGQQSYSNDTLERELLEICGVRFSLLERADIRQIEPDLHDIFSHGVMIDDSISINHPQKLCKAYADLFVSEGGEFYQANVNDLSREGGGWKMTSDHGALLAHKLVLCLGAWTPSLLTPLGYRNPLAIERGYHSVFNPAEGKKLARPVFDVDGSYVIAPMQMGLRVTSGSNLTYRETAPTPRQIEQVIPRARQAFPLGEQLLERPWMGRRPSLPDTLPIIGPAPAHENLWLAFGHSHMGLTLGPISGELIANHVAAGEQPLDATPYLAQRYL